MKASDGQRHGEGHHAPRQGPERPLQGLEQHPVVEAAHRPVLQGQRAVDRDHSAAQEAGRRAEAALRVGEAECAPGDEEGNRVEALRLGEVTGQRGEGAQEKAKPTSE